MARPKVGLSGAALTVGSLGLYLAYAGIRDVPIVEGLRSLLRGEQALAKQGGRVWKNVELQRAAISEGDASPPPAGAIGDSGITQLRGYAALAYPILKAAFPHLRFGGWRAQGSVSGSRHPRGLAIDIAGGVFNRGPSAANATAERIFAVFRSTPGARVWIWNRTIRNRADGWRTRPYDGPSPHTDHVHVDWEG